MTEHSVANGIFTINRIYSHPIEKVWAAWADPQKKYAWFGDPANPSPARLFEFKPGGRESNSAALHDGTSFDFDVTYQDIVPLSRILYSYDMHMNGKKISVSLAAIEFSSAAGGTALKLTEYGLYLDGLDTSAQREAGTIGLMDQLGAWLDRG